MLATPSIGELEINNQGIGADISINTSNNAPKGQFRVRCPAVIQSIRDRNGSLGTAGQVLSSIGGDDFTSLLEWTTPTPAGGGNLQTTLDAGNTATGANANITLTDTGLLQISATQGISIAGNALQSGTSGGNSGQHLVITLNGQLFKIALQNP